MTASESNHIPERDSDEVWRTHSSGIYHTRRCAAVKHADTVLTRDREALTRHFDECEICAGETGHNRLSDVVIEDTIAPEAIADPETVCIGATALRRGVIESYHTENCKFIRRDDAAFGVISRERLPPEADECEHCARGGGRESTSGQSSIRAVEAVPSRSTDQLWGVGNRGNNRTYHDDRTCPRLREATTIRLRDREFMEETRRRCQHCAGTADVSNAGESISTLAWDLKDMDPDAGFEQVSEVLGDE
jgi:hypothetical protein